MHLHWKETVHQIERELGQEFEQVNHFIFSHPEPGLREYASVAYLTDYLREKGFRVTCPYASFETGFRAEYGTKGPTVAFLAEYDALPGYGPDKANGHACGHNWIASTSVGTATVLSRIAEQIGLRVVVIGTPAEETYCSKVVMARDGVFDDVDIVLQAHLSNETSVCSATLAMTSLILAYTGRASHSAAAPWDGINALDAVQLFYAGVNALRQHVKPDVRIHGVVTEGGQAANIVPDKASCLFYVRASTREYLDTVLPKVENVARGAALMTGAALEIRYPELPLDNLVNVPTLQRLTERNYIQNGLTPTMTPERAAVIAGSTDLGSVSHICPTMYVETALTGDETLYAHEESALKLVDSPAAYDTMHRVIRALAGVAVDLALEPALIEQAKRELAGKTGLI